MHTSFLPTLITNSTKSFPRKDSSTNKLEQDLASNPNKESESGSQGLNSIHDEARCPNMELENKYASGDSASKQYRRIFFVSIRDVEPDTLQEYVDNVYPLKHYYLPQNNYNGPNIRHTLVLHSHHTLPHF